MFQTYLTKVFQNISVSWLPMTQRCYQILQGWIAQASLRNFKYFYSATIGRNYCELNFRIRFWAENQRHVIPSDYTEEVVTNDICPPVVTQSTLPRRALTPWHLLLMLSKRMGNFDEATRFWRDLTNKTTNIFNWLLHLLTEITLTCPWCHVHYHQQTSGSHATEMQVIFSPYYNQIQLIFSHSARANDNISYSKRSQN